MYISPRSSSFITCIKYQIQVRTTFNIITKKHVFILEVVVETSRGMFTVESQERVYSGPIPPEIQKETMEDLWGQEYIAKTGEEHEKTKKQFEVSGDYDCEFPSL